MARTVVVCAAHPDDEALGCGGVMARHAREGDAVHVIFAADGVGARSIGNALSEQQSRERQEAAKRAAKILGARPPIFLDFPDQRLDSFPLLDLVQRIEQAVQDLRPAVVYTHHIGDLNMDHRRVAEAVMVAFRPLPGSTVTAIYGFETLSSTEWAAGGPSAQFHPVRYVGITDDLDRKLEALRQYDAEMRAPPHPRSYAAVQALAALRGATVGVAAAEAFTVLRDVLR
jgi:LmbE family N-acetylglucosaminyl deacetylase